MNKNVSHNGSVVNIAPGIDDNTWDHVGNPQVDVLSAPLKTDSGARNLIYISATSMAYAITSIKTVADQQVGESVCFSGSFSNPGYKCGVIEVEGASLTYKRNQDNLYKTVTALTRASMTHVNGDSGSPVISGTLPKAFGILGAHFIDGTKTFYSPIDLSMTALSLRMCLNSSCS